MTDLDLKYLARMLWDLPPIACRRRRQEARVALVPAEESDRLFRLRSK